MDAFVAMRKKDGPELLYLQSWMNRHPQLTAGFSSRNGGVSEAPLQSLNCAMHVNDDVEAVIENRQRIADALGWPFQAWTCAEQVHGKRVGVVKGGQKGSGNRSRASAIADTDALITDHKGILLTAYFADCVPIYLFDPHHPAVGIAHAGWRGTAQNIVGETVRAMEREYGSKADQLLAAIGPSIGGCCYEVDRTVIGRIDEALLAHGMSECALEELRSSNELYRPNGKDKFLLNLKEANRQFMIMAGILPIHIELSQWCTSCSTDLFFSHRKEKGETGRMSGWIGLQEEGE